MDQWASLQLAIQQQQQQAGGLLAPQPYNYSAVFIDHNSTNTKPPVSLPPPPEHLAGDPNIRYDATPMCHQGAVGMGNSSIVASLQATCDKVTHQLSIDADTIMQQMTKCVDEAKHHFRMTVFSLGKHLHDSVIFPQPGYGTETNPQFPQICYNISWEIVKTAQNVSFELTKSLDNSGKELVQASRNAARQLGVDIPDFTYIANDQPPPPAPPPTEQSSQPTAQPHIPTTLHQVPQLRTEQSECHTGVSDVTPRDTPLDTGHVSDDTEDYDPGPASVNTNITTQGGVDTEVKCSDFTPLKEVTELPFPVPLYCVPPSTLEPGKPDTTSSYQTPEFEAMPVAQETQEKTSGHLKGQSKRRHKKTEQSAATKGPYKCEQCDKVFMHQKSQKFHIMRAHTGERPYTCDTCGKAFVRAYEFKRHKETHTGQPQYKCDSCPKEFYQKKSYEFHVMKWHTNERPFACTTCGHGFVRSCDLRDHVIIHSKEKKFVCEYCDRAFLREKNLIQHRTMHTGERTHACKICGERFISLYYVVRHSKKHECSVDGHVLCHHCGQAFEKEELKEHVKIHAKAKELKCDMCDEVFQESQELLEHRQTHAGDKPYICMNKSCDKAFTTAAALERHSKTHGIKKRVAKPKFTNIYVLCDHCGKSVQKGRLQEHVNTHKGERPHKCDQCPKAYYVKKSLQIHKMVKHGGFRPFVCEDCGKRFPTNYDLNKHRLVHDKKHKCGICDRVYSNGKLLIEHMTVHTRETPFKCKLCPEAFSRYAHLAKHCKVTHGQLLSGRKVSTNDSGKVENARKDGQMGEQEDDEESRPEEGE